ncbi:proteasome regulatory non-ATPase subunit 11 [Trypanosoma conorhini]|uniref:Proteasome regulatory non-ATPase subunit 11 n=1 Tax=Trypanosoma conorhini TaxID=83891 RepID=A0A422PC81_9TRYP|nr:proteasome regulatory non-ATPase subunit 11 [Trypanosoma conorhini]RNF15328.1 proteasome regulatory non-ATPase subunit 11 [Trypanosoma conorhini]
MNNIVNMLRAQTGGGNARAAPTEDLRDTAETVQISSLALLKMLLHGRAGVPLEVMGLMIGEQVDNYTIRVTDVFSMPQTATGQSVEAVDPEYQVQMLDKLSVVGRSEKVVGWYHSHPGFGCWLSGEDVMTAGNYEQLTPRSVSVVIDPIQSVRGKVVIDAFRTTKDAIMGGRNVYEEPRQTTSNLGWLTRPSPIALTRGLDRDYYSLPITFRKKNHELALLLNVYKKGWQEGFRLENMEKFDRQTIREKIRTLTSLAEQSERFIAQGLDEDDVGNIGRMNPIIHLQLEAEGLINANLNQTIGAMINGVAF